MIVGFISGAINSIVKDSPAQFDHLFPCSKTPALPQELITGFSGCSSSGAVLSLTQALQDWDCDVIRSQKYHFHRNYRYQTMLDCKMAT